MKRFANLGAAWIALPAIVLFLVLAALVAQGAASALDLAVRDAVHLWASPALTFAMRQITVAGSSLFLLPVGACLVWRLAAKGRRREAVFLVVAALGGEAWDQALKLLFHRARPDAFFGLPQPETYSFPSGHSMASVCFYGALAMIAASELRSPRRRRAIWTGAVVLIALIGFSRIYLGVHYPTDVLGGYLAAVAWLGILRASIVASVTRPGGGPS